MIASHQFRMSFRFPPPTLEEGWDGGPYQARMSDAPPLPQDSMHQHRSETHLTRDHHLLIAFRRLLNRKRLDHRAHSRLGRELQRVLGVLRRSRRPSGNRALCADQLELRDRERVGTRADDYQSAARAETIHQRADRFRDRARWRESRRRRLPCSAPPPRPACPLSI